MASFEALVPILLISCYVLVILCVNFPSYRVANSNTVSSLSRRCLVLIFLLLYSFFSFVSRNTISTAIMWKIFLHQVYTNLAYVTLTDKRVKKYDFSLSIKTYVIPQLVETEMRLSSGSGTILSPCVIPCYKIIPIKNSVRAQYDTFFRI